MAWMRSWSIALLSFVCCFSCAYACTDIRLSAKDGTILVARSMEFSLDMQANLMTSNRGRVFTTPAVNNQPGLTWKAKYGYAFLNGMNVDMAVDGMNEKGLSFGALYLPTYAQYQTVPPGQEKQALPYYHLGDWILGNFDNIEQVRDAISKIYVYSAKIPSMGDTIFPLHFSIYDATGKGLVIEYVGGKLTVYDNVVGVLTNSPTFDWHFINLGNYTNLSPKNPNPVIMNGITYAATGQGFGMAGLPGDISPPSRFVKMATFLQVIMQPADATSVLNMGEHLLNNVDIPNGLAREPSNGNFTTDITQWVAFKDLTHRIFYYRTYNNLSLRGIVLDKLNFAENAPRLKMPIASTPFIQDMTAAFNKTAAPLPAPAPAPAPAATATPKG